MGSATSSEATPVDCYQTIFQAAKSMLAGWFASEEKALMISKVGKAASVKNIRAKTIGYDRLRI